MTDKKLTMFTKKDIVSYILLIINGVGGITALNYTAYYREYNLMLLGLMVMWGINLLVCCLDIKRRIIAFLFHLMIFLFLISRILIPGLKGTKWWLYFSEGANAFGIRVISYSMLAIVAGVLVTEILMKFSTGNKVHVKKRSLIDRAILMKVIRIILLVCMICFFCVEIDKLLFMRGRIYEDYFTYYQTRMPFFITIPAGCMSFILCMFLALKPSKKEAFIWLVLYVVSAMPMLKIGIRNAFILNCVFAFVYYFLRDVIRQDDEKKWIGKLEKALIICAVPAMILFSGAYNYIRDDKAVDLSAADLVVDFAYKQGTTYDTVLQGFINKDKLLWKDEHIYTFGAVADSFYYNSLGKKIFGVEDIGSGNSLRMVYDGHTFSHALSYVVLGKNYIAGEGRGSSYIIENYIDWGNPGVIIFSIFLGIICSLIPQLFGKGWISSIVILNIITNFFFTPRAESLAFITFLFSYKFWGCIIGCVILTKMCQIFMKRTINTQKTL